MKPSHARTSSRSRGSSATALGRRDEVLAKAAVLFAERGFASTTVREIADAVGLLSGSLYHHFDSKEAILDEILRGVLEQLLTEQRMIVAEADTPRAALERLVLHAFTAIDERGAELSVYQKEFRLVAAHPRFGNVAQLAKQFERLWTGVLRDGMRSGDFRSDLDPAIAHRFIRDAVWTSVHWHRPGGKLTPHAMADQYLTLLVDGLRPGS